MMFQELVDAVKQTGEESIEVLVLLNVILSEFLLHRRLSQYRVLQTKSQEHDCLHRYAALVTNLVAHERIFHSFLLSRAGIEI